MVPRICHRGGKRTLTIFTTHDDHYHMNYRKERFLQCENGSAVVIARSSIRAYEGEPNDLKKNFLSYIR